MRMTNAGWLCRTYTLVMTKEVLDVIINILRRRDNIKYLNMYCKQGYITVQHYYITDGVFKINEIL